MWVTCASLIFLLLKLKVRTSDQPAQAAPILRQVTIVDLNQTQIEVEKQLKRFNIRF